MTISVWLKRYNFLFDRVENIVGKGENAGYQHFLLFLQCLQKTAFTEPLKGLLCQMHHLLAEELSINSDYKIPTSTYFNYVYMYDGLFIKQTMKHLSSIRD